MMVYAYTIIETNAEGSCTRGGQQDRLDATVTELQSIQRPPLLVEDIPENNK
jgi:hypothetical protein